MRWIQAGTGGIHFRKGSSMNVFEAVKQSVTARQAAEAYGIRTGRSGMACCPFHDDKNPSMKLDRRFHCFSCHADGDVIDFVSRLFGIDAAKAALKLASDFSVSFEYNGRRSSGLEPDKKSVCKDLLYRKEKQRTFRLLTDYLHLLQRWETEYAPKNPGDAWHPFFLEAVQRKSYVEYLTDTLLLGTEQEQKCIIQEKREELDKMERRLLQCSKTGFREGFMQLDRKI